MTSAKKVISWVDVACPTCGADESQGCMVMGRETIMKVRYRPHKSREMEARLRTSSGSGGSKE